MRHGLTAFLFDAKQEGWEIERRIPIMGPEEHGGHCELRFDNLEIPDSQRLMEVGEGLKATQIRLGTARLTHCMRWLGMAQRAMAIAADYVAERESFGEKLHEHEGVQWMLGEAAMDVEIGRLLTMRAAWRLDQGLPANRQIAQAKLYASEMLAKVTDETIQIYGGMGLMEALPLERFWRDARVERIYDGTSEIQRHIISRELLRPHGA